MAITTPAKRGLPFRGRRGWQLLAVGAGTVLVAIGVALGLNLWQERDLARADQALRTGDARRALALSEYFLETHPDHARGEALRARALVAAGRPTEAIAVFERIGGATAEEMHAWARAYLMEESWSRALNMLEQVLRMNPEDVDALYELTTCRTRLGLFAEAIESAERFSSLPGQEARGALLMAVIRNDMSRYDEALAAYAETARLVPDGTGLQVPPEEFFIQYGTVLVNQGRGAEAIPLLDKSLAARRTGAALFLLGKARSQSGDTEGARLAWEEAVDIDPTGVSPRESLADAALAAGDAATAHRWLDPLREVAEGRFQSAYLMQRLAALEKDDAAFTIWQERATRLREHDQMMLSLEQLMHSAPHSFWANVVRAHKFAYLGNWRQAEDLLEALGRTAPEEPFVKDLQEAVRTRGPLPDLKRLPINRF